VTGDEMMGTVPGCDLMDGVLVVHKEVGWTSHDVVAKIRHLLGGTKVGHAGTLDPAATGVLPVLIGKGTRIAEYLVEWDKEYRAVLRLG
jgi:tRNA pseudouridine55 synthase